MYFCYHGILLSYGIRTDKVIHFKKLRKHCSLTLCDEDSTPELAEIPQELLSTTLGAPATITELQKNNYKLVVGYTKKHLKENLF